MAQDNGHSPRSKSIDESNAIDANRHVNSGVEFCTAEQHNLSEQELKCETERMPKKETITTQFNSYAQQNLEDIELTMVH